MLRHLKAGAALAALMALATPATAADLALILANGDYEELEDLRGGTNPAQARKALETAGFTVLAEDDADAGEVRARLARLIELAPKSDRIVVALSGRFWHSAQESWLMPTDSGRAGLVDALEKGLPLSAVLTVLADHPGQAVLLLGSAPRADDPAPAGGFVQEGPGVLTIPQGVTVLTGTPQAMAALLGGDLIRPGAPLATAAARAGLSAQGYLPKGFVVFPVGENLAPTPATAAPAAPAAAAPAPGDEARAYWDLAEREDTQAAYQLYLDRYPKGANATDAKARIAAIEAEPNRAAKLAEEALALNRDQRREVQQNLTILNHDPKGVDGIFGPGTRAAIGRWQTAGGEPVSGYLSRDQLTRLSAQGAKRAAELEAEAAARRAEQERQDQIYWNQTGAAGDEAGLRAYLKKYPDGLFADLATERLAPFEAARRAEAEAEDRAAWDRAVQADSAAAYSDYLASRKAPAFREEAEARLTQLRADQDGAAERARAESTEAALNLPGVALGLVEGQLAQLGLKPGKVDGRIDDDTRRAIRRFQQASDMPVTGYLDQATVAQLLAGGIKLK